jgi:phage-related tail fiber protein
MSKKFLTGIDLNNQKAVNLADGSNPTDAVTKQQLDASMRGLDWKSSVRAATTANITLTAAQTVDGVSLIAGDRVLVMSQTNAAQNGIYVVASGAWTRAVDSDASTEVTSGLAVTVTEGTVNGDKVFILATNDPITLDTTSLTFTPLGGGGNSYTAGSGLALTGSQFSAVAKPSGGLVVDGSGISIDSGYTGAAKRYAVNVPTGSTSAAITHGLNTLDVVVAVYEISTGIEVECDVVLTSTTVVTLTFAVAPTSGQYRVVVVG